MVEINIFVAYKLPSLWCFVIGTQEDLYTYIFEGSMHQRGNYKGIKNANEMKLWHIKKILMLLSLYMGFPGVSDGKDSAWSELAAYIII